MLAKRTGSVQRRSASIARRPPGHPRRVDPKRGLALARLLCVVFIAACSGAVAQAVPEAWKGVPRGKLLEHWLKARLGEKFAERKKAVGLIRKADAARKRQQQMRATFRGLVGELPAKTPLNTRVVGTIQRERYRIDKLIYESRPGLFVTANLYMPKSASAQNKVPGVLIPCGHALHAKAYPLYQSAGAGLAHHGIAALVFDPIGQGERMQLLDAKGKHRVWGTSEHTLFGMRALLLGSSCAAWMLHDAVRSLDVLAEHPNVDASKLGCSGNSGGGTQTSLLMAYDERVVAAAPCCYITSFEKLFATIGPQDDEQNLPGQVAAGFEHADFITARMPKPTMILAATRDFFSIDGTWDSFREVKRLYGLLGRGDHVDLYEYDDGHGHSKPRRAAAQRFFLRWLKGQDAPLLDEPKLQLCKTSELLCTKTGQVLTSIEGAKSVFELVREEADRVAKRAKPEGLDLRARVAALSFVERRSGVELKVHSNGRVWLTVDGFPLSGRAYRASVDTKRVIVVCEDPKQSLDKAAIEALRKRGHVLLVDVRGFGWSSVAKNRKYGGQYWSEFDASYYAMQLGTSLVALRAHDLAQWLLADMARIFPDSAVSALEVHATGRATVPALHAALLSEVDRVVLRGGLRSWRALFESPFARGQLGSVVPMALHMYDLPDIVEALGKNRVKIRDPLKLPARR